MIKDPRVPLAQILERIVRIQRFTSAGRQIFLDDLMVQDAVIRNFEVIREAAKRVPDDYRKDHPEIPWKDLAGFRDVLIHQYEGISPELVWSTVEERLPALREALEGLLPSLQELEEELGRSSSPSADKDIRS